MKKICSFISFGIGMCLSTVINAQQLPGEITGLVMSQTNNSIPGVSIVLNDTKTGKTISSTVTNEKGIFKLNASFSPGMYLSVNHTGYVPFKIVTIPDSALVIKLTEQSTQLKEVVINSQRPFLEQQFDRMVVNVDGSSKAGINAADILTKLPGITLINQDQLLLEGKGATITIDGKSTRLSGNDLMRLLNSTNVKNISQIELLYTPSAKYDAQGGGIINIKTLKRTKPGYDAYIGGTAGHGWKYFYNNDLSTGINYRNNNSYIYSSYSYGLGKQSQEVLTNTYLADINQRLRDLTVTANPYHSQNLRLGLDQYLTKNDILGFLFTGYINSNKSSVNTLTGIYQLAGSTQDSTRFSDNYSPRTSKGGNFNINLKLLLDSATQKEITMDADAGLFKFENDNTLNTILRGNNSVSLFPVQIIDQQSNTLSKIFSYKADYSQKLAKGTLEAGFKGSYVNINNRFISVGGIINQALIDNGSNDFIYKEGVIASYLSVKQVWNKLTVQAGLRGEQTITDGNSVTLDSLVKRRYFNLFPNLTLGYKFKNSSLSAAYARRIARPAYNYLNPFTTIRSAYYISQGNPYLRPSFTDSYRLGYNFLSKYSFTVSYASGKNVISDLKYVNDTTKVTTNIKQNLSRFKNIDLYFTYYNKLFKVLTLSYAVGLSRSKYQFSYDNQAIDVSQTTGYTSLDNRLALPKSWWLSVFFYGQTKVTYGNQINRPFSTTGISGGKDILKGKGTLSVSANDIFFTGITRSYASYGNVNYELRSQYDSRNFKLTFNYNFGSTTVKIRRRTSGSAEEQKRNTQ